MKIEEDEKKFHVFWFLMKLKKSFMYFRQNAPKKSDLNSNNCNFKRKDQREFSNNARWTTFLNVCGGNLNRLYRLCVGLNFKLGTFLDHKHK